MFCEPMCWFGLTKHLISCKITITLLRKLWNFNLLWRKLWYYTNIDWKIYGTIPKQEDFFLKTKTSLVCRKCIYMYLQSQCFYYYNTITHSLFFFYQNIIDLGSFSNRWSVSLIMFFLMSVIFDYKFKEV